MTAVRANIPWGQGPGIMPPSIMSWGERGAREHRTYLLVYAVVSYGV